METLMTKNMGGTDSAIRAVLGSLIMVSAAVAADPHPFLALGGALVAVAILITAIAGVCPLYTLLGLNTGPQTRPRMPVKPEPAHQLR